MAVTHGSDAVPGAYAVAYPAVAHYCTGSRAHAHSWGREMCPTSRCRQPTTNRQHLTHVAYRAGSHVELERVPPEQMPPAELAARRSRLVFIGRTAGLEATLREGFEAL